MSAAPFEIRTSRPEGVLRCEVWNNQSDRRIKVFKGQTARRRAEFWIEALRVGYFTTRSPEHQAIAEATEKEKERQLTELAEWEAKRNGR